MGKRIKNACMICNNPVTDEDGLRCRGKCKRWSHYKCINCGEQKLSLIKSGVITLKCPCPDCESVSNMATITIDENDALGIIVDSSHGLMSERERNEEERQLQRRLRAIRHTTPAGTREEDTKKGCRGGPPDEDSSKRCYVPNSHDCRSNFRGRESEPYYDPNSSDYETDFQGEGEKRTRCRGLDEKCRIISGSVDCYESNSFTHESNFDVENKSKCGDYNDFGIKLEKKTNKNKGDEERTKRKTDKTIDQFSQGLDEECCEDFQKVIKEICPDDIRDRRRLERKRKEIHDQREESRCCPRSGANDMIGGSYDRRELSYEALNTPFGTCQSGVGNEGQQIDMDVSKKLREECLGTNDTRQATLGANNKSRVSKRIGCSTQYAQETCIRHIASEKCVCPKADPGSQNPPPAPKEPKLIEPKKCCCSPLEPLRGAKQMPQPPRPQKINVNKPQPTNNNKPRTREPCCCPSPVAQKKTKPPEPTQCGIPGPPVVRPAKPNLPCCCPAPTPPQKQEQQIAPRNVPHPKQPTSPRPCDCTPQNAQKKPSLPELRHYPRSDPNSSPPKQPGKPCPPELCHCSPPPGPPKSRPDKPPPLPPSPSQEWYPSPNSHSPPNFPLPPNCHIIPREPVQKTPSACPIQRPCPNNTSPSNSISFKIIPRPKPPKPPEPKKNTNAKCPSKGACNTPCRPSGICPSRSQQCNTMSSISTFSLKESMTPEWLPKENFDDRQDGYTTEVKNSFTHKSCRDHAQDTPQFAYTYKSSSDTMVMTNPDINIWETAEMIHKTMGLLVAQIKMLTEKIADNLNERLELSHGVQTC